MMTVQLFPDGSTWVRVGRDGAVLRGAASAPPSTPNYFTGGIVTVNDGYRYHTFNSSSTLTFIDADGLGTAVDVDYLVVAGGGAGTNGYDASAAAGGGGGSGGMLTASAYALSATQTITVGAGGSGSTSAQGTNGSNSSLGAIAVAVGGGAGADRTPPSGNSGGSAGGGNGCIAADGAPTGGTATAGQGSAGGDGFQSATALARAAGGGGGKAAVGGNASSATGGNGGAGSEWPASSGSFYAGGGGGGATSGGAGVAGSGGTGGGGNGGSGAAGTAGTANTGGGGGGCDGTGTAGGAGGSGVVIVRYVDDPSMPTVLPVANDTFDRADGLIGTADSGQVYEVLGTWEVSGNAAVITVGTNRTAMLPTGVADLTIEVDIVHDTGEVGIYFRYVDASNWWRALVDASGNTFLQRCIAGTITNQGGSGGSGAAASRNCKVVAVGDSIQFLVDGVLRRSVTDSTHATATKHGLGNAGAAGTTTWNDLVMTQEVV